MEIADAENIFSQFFNVFANSYCGLFVTTSPKIEVYFLSFEATDKPCFWVIS